MQAPHHPHKLVLADLSHSCRGG